MKSMGLQHDNQPVDTKVVKAGKRTYYLDIHRGRNEQHYITITERKKRMDGTSESHKLFLYPEDVNKFLGNLEESVRRLKELMPAFGFENPSREREDKYSPAYGAQ